MTYSEFLCSCYLTNEDRLVVNDNYVDYNDIANKLRHDILNNDIPHMRPIGLNVGNISNELTFVDELDVIHKSYYDLMVSMRNVVFLEPCGFDSNQRVKDSLRNYYHSEELEGGIAVLGESDVYTGDGNITFCKTSKKASFLINGIPLVTGATRPYIVYILYMTGTGYLPASKMSRVLRYCQYKPITTEFSLSDYVLIDARPSDMGIKLHFKRQLDKEGFLGILRKYGNKLEGV